MTTHTGNRRRAVVTGQGMVTPLGRTPDDIWSRWQSGDVAAAPVTRMDLSFYGLQYAAEVGDFQPRKEITNRKLLRLMIDGEAFGFVAATRAFEDAGLTVDDYVSDRAGVSIGCHKEGFRDANLYDALDIATRDDGTLDRELLIEDGIRRIPPQTLVEGLANAALYYFAHQFVLQGVNHNFIASGSSSMQALGEAMRDIRRGEADVMLAGGYDSYVNWRCIGHQHYFEALSMSDGPANTLQKPFDRDRDGGVVGEGAGMLVLEDRDRAIERGATIHGEISGYAAGSGVGTEDAERHAEAYARVIRRALQNAGCEPQQIDLVHLQGEGSLSSDRIEAIAVHNVLGARSERVPVTTIKSATGMLGNASGPVELLMTLEMLRRGEVLPITNLQNPDPELPLNYVREPLADKSLKTALVLQRSWPNHLTALIVTPGTN